MPRFIGMDYILNSYHNASMSRMRNYAGGFEARITQLLDEGNVLSGCSDDFKQHCSSLLKEGLKLWNFPMVLKMKAFRKEFWITGLRRAFQAGD